MQPHSDFQQVTGVKFAPLYYEPARVVFGVCCCCVQVAMQVCFSVVCRADKHAPEEGAAKEPKVARRSSKVQQEEGGDAPEKDKQRGSEEKKVGDQFLSVACHQLPSVTYHQFPSVLNSLASAY